MIQAYEAAWSRLRDLDIKASPAEELDLRAVAEPSKATKAVKRNMVVYLFLNTVGLC